MYDETTAAARTSVGEIPVYCAYDDIVQIGHIFL